MVPARLATVYSSAAAVETMLHERAADFRKALARIAERSEWGVKAFVATLPPGRTGLPDLRRKDLAASRPAPGRPTCNGGGSN